MLRSPQHLAGIAPRRSAPPGRRESASAVAAVRSPCRADSRDVVPRLPQLAEAADQATRESHLLAQVNFYEALQPGDTTTPVWQSVDVTRVVGALAKQGMLETAATLTILAARPFDPKSRPSVGRIAIVQQ